MIKEIVQKLKKIHVWKEIFHFVKFLKVIFQKIKSSKIDQWQLRYDYFPPDLKGYSLGLP